MSEVTRHILDVFMTVPDVAPYQGAYEPWLVLISISIAILAAFVALSTSSRIVAATSWRGRWAWTGAGALSMGGGIWAMHFVGMLAFSLPCGISYDPLWTMLSMIPGVLASWVALYVISHVTDPSPKRLAAGAVLMGAGIGTMHYAGMAAMRPEALVRYEPGAVAISVIVAVVLAFVSLEIRFRLRRTMISPGLANGAAAAIMGLAVAGMHYCAMRAAVFFPAQVAHAADVAPPSTLMALLIAVISVLIAAIVLIACIAGIRSELLAGLKIEVGRREALEQEAEGGRARLQAIVDGVIDAIVTIDQHGEIQQWSSGAQRIFGYTAEEVVGANLMMLMPEPYRSGHAGYLASFLRTRDAKIIGIGRELTAIRKDGTEFPIELAISEVRYGDELFFTGILRDITERKRAEAELVGARETAEAAEQESENGRARLQAIFDAVIDAIVTTDKDGRIQQWSSGAQRIFGYTPEEIVGANFASLMPEPVRPGTAGDIASFLQPHDSRISGFGRELTAIRKDGTRFPIELDLSEVRDGEAVFFTGILRDITERKRVEAELVRAREAAEAANLAKSQFLATMSHEIRTPMNGVLGMANLLASTVLNDRQQRLVENVSRSGQALLGIINDILDFAKIEAGKFELSAVPFDPRDAIAELSDLFSERCTAKGLEFIYFVAEDVPSRIVGDPARLRQILVNLVGNAVKFTERGEILVELSLVRNEAGRVVLNFTIEDTGVGIAAEECARVFDSFHQVDGSMTRARGGSGLGLSITRQLVELMGGRISVESELGRGSRFTFSAQFQQSPSEAGSPRMKRHLARPLRALLADANAVSAHVITLYLANWDVDASIVSTLEEAEAIWHEADAAGQPFDVAILDVKGFGAPAVAFANLVRAAPRARPAGMILMVGLDSYMTDRSLETLDATAILPKPLRPSELFNALVSIASEGISGTVRPHVARRKMRPERPNFGARVLVVEDNAVNQEVATGILETMGCRIVTAPNGRTAVRLFAQERFDVILMDCEMPVMNGIDATRRIRDIEAMAGALPDSGQTRQRTPIIAVTAHALNEVRETCLAAGMDDFLVKPFDEQQMAETLLRWLTPNRADDVTTDVAPLAVIVEPPGETDSIIDDASAIDPTVTESLRARDRKGGPSRFGRAVACFVEIAPPLLASMRTACAETDAEALRLAAHSLKSSAGALGAKQVALRCADIEQRAPDADMEDMRHLIASLGGELAAAIRGLEALTGEMHVPA
jgi:two-component system sensor histidine kinase/response regulator